MILPIAIIIRNRQIIAQHNNAEDDWLMIQYSVQDTQVKRITIGDIRYIQTLT